MMPEPDLEQAFLRFFEDARSDDPLTDRELVGRGHRAPSARGALVGHRDRRAHARDRRRSGRASRAPMRWPSSTGSSGDFLEAFGAAEHRHARGLPRRAALRAAAPAPAVGAGDRDGVRAHVGRRGRGRLELLHALPVGRQAVWLGRFGSLAGRARVRRSGHRERSSPRRSVCSQLEDVPVSRVLARDGRMRAPRRLPRRRRLRGRRVRSSARVAVGASVLVLVAGYVDELPLPAVGLTRRRALPLAVALGDRPAARHRRPRPRVGSPCSSSSPPRSSSPARSPSIDATSAQPDRSGPRLSGRRPRRA